MSSTDIKLNSQQKDIVEWAISGEGHLLIQALAGTGKCLGKGTPVMKYDGSIVPVEDVERGDTLMGPDSLPRRVLSTSTGMGQLYRIEPVKGDSWVCNDVHILTLKGTNNLNGQIFDVPIGEMLTVQEKKGRPDKQLKLFRVPVDFAPQDVPFDPYLAGLWLGDGTNGELQWTFGVSKTKLAEIVDRAASKYDVLSTIRWDEENNSYNIRWGMHLREGKRPEGHGRYKRFELQEQIVGLLSPGSQKTIPDQYLHNSRSVRLSILAGILDTDGSDNGGGGYEVVTKYESLKNGILYLSRSLGFSAYSSDKWVKLSGWEEARLYYRITISGDTSQIPCVRHEKHIRKQCKDVLKTGFMIRKEGSQAQQYFGFTLDGDGRFLLGDFTVTHNTSTLLALLPYLSGSVVYMAFNKAVQLETEAKVRGIYTACSVDVKTVHALGLAALPREWKQRDHIVDNKIRFMLEDLAEKDKERPGLLSHYNEYRAFIAKLVQYGKQAGGGVLWDIADTEAWLELVSYYSVDDELPSRGGKTYGPEGNGDTLVERIIPLVQNVYQLSLDACPNSIDFGDMMIAGLHYGFKFRKYDWVLFDEVQDSSDIRQELAVQSLKDGGRMVCVGDRLQNLYSFTGSKSNAMDTFKTRLNMAELPLTTNYRCAKTVISMAQQFAPDLQPHAGAPEGVYRVITMDRNATNPTARCFWDEVHGLGPDDVILCRKNRPLIELAYQLLRMSIPCQIEGRDAATGLIRLCQKWKVVTLDELEDKLETYKDKEVEKWMMKKNNERAAYVEDKVDTLVCLLDSVRKTGKHRVIDLVDKINAMFGDTEPGKKPKVLTLSSIHRSKGKEFKRVYLLGRAAYRSKWAKKDWEIQVEDVCLPYVSITRAREELVDVVVAAE